jgi:hypothetical protein
MMMMAVALRAGSDGSKEMMMAVVFLQGKTTVTAQLRKMAT